MEQRGLHLDPQAAWALEIPKPISSDTLPPTSHGYSNNAKVPNSSQEVPLPDGQAVKNISIRGSFLPQPPHLLYQKFLEWCILKYLNAIVSLKLLFLLILESKNELKLSLTHEILSPLWYSPRAPSLLY